MAVGHLGERDCLRDLDRGVAAPVLVRRQFRHLQRDLWVARGRDRVHGLDVAFDHRGFGWR